MKKLLAVVGPTGSGKSELALLLATRLNGEIISADSRQVYRYLDIGTSKPSKGDRTQVVHHFIDILDPKEEYSAGDYGRQARATIEEVFERRKQPILVGGSGLYVKAVIDGFFNGPGKDPELRKQLESRLSDDGAAGLLATLRKVDPVAAQRMDTTKPRRIIRALEVYYITGKPLTEFHKEQENEAPFVAMQFGLEWDRRKLYARIDSRVNRMVTEGLVEEVRGLQRKGYTRTLNALNSVGYKEVFDHLEGKLNYEATIELMQRNTRRFAKRQLTWFRADHRIQWVKMDDQSLFDKPAEMVIRRFESM